MRRISDKERIYEFDADPTEMLQAINDTFIAEVNDAICLGQPTPKSKSIDIIQGVAVALHIFQHILGALLSRTELTKPGLQVSQQSLRRGKQFVEWANSQKEIVAEYVAAILQPVMEAEIPQPDIGIHVSIL